MKFIKEILLALLENLLQFISRQLFAAARGDDGGFCDSTSGGVIEGNTHFTEFGGESTVADKVGEEVDAVLGVLHKPDRLRPSVEFLFCRLIDVAVEHGMQYGA